MYLWKNKKNIKCRGKSANVDFNREDEKRIIYAFGLKIIRYIR